MSPDILIVRVGDGYRLLHGHLRLANLLSMAGEASVDVQGGGKVRIVQTRNGPQVNRGSQLIAPLGN